MNFLAKVRRKRNIIIPLEINVKEGDIVRCSIEKIEKRS
jgi:hypothetical protein